MTPDGAPILVVLAHEAPFRLGPLEVRPATREILAGDRRRMLEPRIMQVLVALARRRGKVVSRDDLIGACWGGRIVGEDAIDRCISAIRRLAETYGGFSVETVVRVGYRLTEGRLDQAGVGPGAWRRLRASAWARVAAVLAVAAVAVLGFWLLRGPGAPARNPSEVRVAVLPFAALSTDPSMRYFADSLREEILGVLASNQVLAVSNNDSRALHGPDSRQALDRLGVRLLLDGTVRRDGDTLRVRLHLDDPRAHIILWSRDFAGPAADPEGLQTRVARHATMVTNWLTSDRYGLGAKIDPATLAIYAEAGDESQNGVGERFIPLFRQVVARAPDFSWGHSALALSLTEALDKAPAAARPQIQAEALKEARRALALDPHNGEGHLTLAMLTPLTAWKYREGILSKGLAADPGSPYVPDVYGMLLADAGRGAEALLMAQRAVAAEGWSRNHANLAQRLVDQGQLQQGRAAIDQALRLWPDDPYLEATRFRLTMESAPSATALQALDDPATRELGLSPAAIGAWRTWLRARESADPAARRDAAAAVGRAADAGELARRDAIVALARLGDTDAAFAQADRLYTGRRLQPPYGYDDATSFLFVPATRPLRRDPRFMPLAARLGLVDYWRSTGRWPDFCSEPDLRHVCEASR